MTLGHINTFWYQVPHQTDLIWISSMPKNLMWKFLKITRFLIFFENTKQKGCLSDHLSKYGRPQIYLSEKGDIKLSFATRFMFLAFLLMVLWAWEVECTYIYCIHVYYICTFMGATHRLSLKTLDRIFF